MSRPQLSSRARSGAGLLAGTLALEWAASRVDDAVTFAPLAVGDRLIRLTPGDAATLAINTLGKTASHALAVRR